MAGRLTSGGTLFGLVSHGFSGFTLDLEYVVKLFPDLSIAIASTSGAAWRLQLSPNQTHSNTHLKTNTLSFLSIPKPTKTITPAKLSTPEFTMAPANQQNGVWVWVPLLESDTNPADQYNPLTSHIALEGSTNSHILGEVSPNLIPDFSNSPESFIPSPDDSSSSIAPDSSLSPDGFISDPQLFPSPINIPLDGESDGSLDLDLGIHLGLVGGIELPAAAPATTFPEPDLLAPFEDVDWNFGLEMSTSSPSATSTFDPISLFHAPSATCSRRSIFPSIPTPTIPSSTHLALPPLQPASPPVARPAAEHKTYRCSTCQKAYSKRCELTKHERKHLKPHRCQLCSFGSAELRGLQRHLWATHRKVAEESGVPKQIAHCDHPGCKYEGRLDNLTRHMKTHEKKKGKAKKATTATGAR